MEAEFWHQRWEREEIGFHQDEVNTHLQAFWGELAIAPGDTLLVPLCGKSRDMLWLRAQGYRVLGVEISPLAVAAFFQEHQLTPVVSRQGVFERWESDGLTLLVGDLFSLQPSDVAEVRAVYDRAALIALPTVMREAYAAHLKKIVPTEAQILLVTLEYPQEQMGGPPFSVAETEVRALFAADYDISTLLSLDILEENPRFQKKGLTRLQEQVFRLVPDGGGEMPSP